MKHSSLITLVEKKGRVLLFDIFGLRALEKRGDDIVTVFSDGVEIYRDRASGLDHTWKIGGQLFTDRREYAEALRAKGW